HLLPPSIASQALAQSQINDLFSFNLRRLWIDPQLHHELENRPHARHRRTDITWQLFHDVQIGCLYSLRTRYLEVFSHGLKHALLVRRVTDVIDGIHGRAPEPLDHWRIGFKNLSRRHHAARLERDI